MSRVNEIRDYLYAARGDLGDLSYKPSTAIFEEGVAFEVDDEWIRFMRCQVGVSLRRTHLAQILKMDAGILMTEDDAAFQDLVDLLCKYESLNSENEKVLSFACK